MLAEHHQGMRLLLRVEGMSLLVVALMAYQQFDLSWNLFAWCFLLPDLALLAYVAGPRYGAWAYNTTHSYLLPGLLIAWYCWQPQAVVLQAALIWFAHIGMDRALGYGLKYSTGFTDTHLGRIGRQHSANNQIDPR